MASETIAEVETNPTAEDMELENPQSEPNSEVSDPVEKDPAPNGDANSKREREGEEENGSVSKKQKAEEEEKSEEKEVMEKSVEEERMDKSEAEKGSDDGEMQDPEKEKSAPVELGPKTFRSSVEMFDYFYKLLHHWPLHVRVNKYEYMVLLDLVKKGHPEPDKKISSGVNAFEIRHHSMWKSRCFFVIRADESVEDFSFRKCVDHILPLPENMKGKSDVNQALRGGGRKGGGRGRGGGRGHGRGRGGKSRR